jgi:hypothetical protein
VASGASRAASFSSTELPATLNLEQILEVLYRSRMNFGHVPATSQAINWLSMNFKAKLEEAALAAGPQPGPGGRQP